MRPVNGYAEVSHSVHWVSQDWYWYVHDNFQSEHVLFCRTHAVGHVAQVVEYPVTDAQLATDSHHGAVQLPTTQAFHAAFLLNQLVHIHAQVLSLLPVHCALVGNHVHTVHVPVLTVLVEIAFIFAGLHVGLWYHALHLIVGIVIWHDVAAFLITQVADPELIEATHAHFLNVPIIVLSVIA